MNIELVKNIKRYKPEEVCEILNICYKTLYRYDKNNVLRARRSPTNRTFYLESDIQDFIKRSSM